MKRFEITVHGQPAPQGSKRHVGNGVMVESSKKVKPWRQDVATAAVEATHGIDFEPFATAVEIRVDFAFNRPKSHYRTGRNAHLLKDAAPEHVATKPDIDKLLRSTFDALSTAGIWTDDNLAAVVRATKTYSPIAGAHIVIKEIVK